MASESWYISGVGPLPCSYESVKDHVDGLGKYKLNPKGDFTVIRGDDKEGWDGMWMMRQYGNDNHRAFVLIIECKSAGLTSTGRNVVRSIDTKQAERFKDVIVPKCVEYSEREKDIESAATAIARGDFAYVYIDTASKAPRHKKEANILQLFPEETLLGSYIRIRGNATNSFLMDFGRQLLEMVRLSSTDKKKRINSKK
jgi:hypothetical protein